MEISPKIGKEVIEGCKAGDREAFEKIVLFCQKRVFNYAYRMVGNMEEAKELAQEVFVSVFQSIKSLRDDAKFEGWLKQITVNHCRNRWKYLKRRHYFNTDSMDDPIETEDGEVTKSFADPSDTPDTAYEKKMVQEWIQKGLLRLKEDQRELIVLRHLQELSYDEMGKCLNLPEGTVKSKLHRARMDLKEILGRDVH
jgi:RNA polymerase sigma-70 factor (ECF subfamily)